MSTAEATRAAVSESAEERQHPSRSMSIGYLAMLPLFIAFEAAAWAAPDQPVNAVVALGDRALAAFDLASAHTRWLLLGIGAVVALGISYYRHVAIVASAARVILEGLLAACILGPLMVILVHAFEGWVPAMDVSWNPTAHPPSLVDTAFVFGAGAWEELGFRVVGYSFLYWLGLRFVTALGGGPRAARVLAEALGLGGSSLCFALAHFDPVLSWLGLPTRPWSPEAFSWLCLGGVLLGLIFRWRGPGVAAWAHGLFNVALWIGIDPDVIW